MISQDIYQQMKKYAAKVIHSKGLKNVTALDIVHDVLCNEDFSIKVWRKLITRHVFIEYEVLVSFFPLDEVYACYEPSVEYLKRCPSCNIDYPESWFNKLKTCKNCYREKNRDKQYESAKKFRLANKGKYKDYNRAYTKKYNEENREKLKKYKAEYYQKNKEHLDALAKKRKK